MPRAANGASQPTRHRGRSAYYRIAPFAVFIGLLAAQALLASLGLGGEEAQRALTIFRALAAAALLAFFWREYRELLRPPPTAAREWAIALIVGFALFGVWITFDHGWAVLGAPARGFVPLASDGRVDPGLAALRFFSLAAAVPVMEELFWRSFLLRWIDTRDFLDADPRRASWRAFALSCALFASEHSLWFAGAVAGAAYTWVYMRSANLWVPILAHAITNGTLGLWILATANWQYW